ncbi:MAG: VOC family protein [Bacteroidota bacterium]|nr:VOC family protein [Bacteroidota bacterium]
MIQGEITWFEIPVSDLDRAMKFYSNVLSIKMEKTIFIDKEYAIFNKDKGSLKGVLALKENHQPCHGIVLFFYTVDLSESMKAVEVSGGKIIISKTLLKKKASGGAMTISNNLIDGNIGYYAEIIDSEGNQICLYSNS